MRRLVLILCIILSIFIPQRYMITGDNNVLFKTKQNITSMEALDRVKELYAANFVKADRKDTREEYYYRLPSADYYLVYEGGGESEKEYVFHLYEFVTDEPETGIGHTVTYGWYKVSKESGLVTEQTQ